MSLYLSKRELNGPVPPRWVELEQNYHELERLFDRLQMISRPLCVTVVRSPLGRLVEERLPHWLSWCVPYGHTLQLGRPDRDITGDFDPIHLGLALDAFLAWRAESASGPRKLALSWRVDGGEFVVDWKEELAASAWAAPAAEMPVTPTAAPSRRADCLALPLLARVIHAHGGSHETIREPSFKLRLRWPRFQACHKAT